MVVNVSEPTAKPVRVYCVAHVQRPFIAFEYCLRRAIGIYLHMHAARDVNQTMLKHILRYIKGTIGFSV